MFEHLVAKPALHSVAVSVERPVVFGRLSSTTSPAATRRP
jgi:hypothetical protein